MYTYIIYLQEDLLQEAAAHCYTYEYFNPHDRAAHSNVEIYQDKLKETEISRKETLKYRDLYVLGQELYDEEKFEEMVKVFEEALVAYIEALQKCR